MTPGARAGRGPVPEKELAPRGWAPRSQRLGGRPLHRRAGGDRRRPAQPADEASGDRCRGAAMVGCWRWRVVLSHACCRVATECGTRDRDSLAQMRVAHRSAEARSCATWHEAAAALSPRRFSVGASHVHTRDMVRHDSIVRIVVGDELGYTRCAQSADSTATAFPVVARWGEGARAAGVERMSTAHGNDEEPSSWVAGACPASSPSSAAAASTSALLRSAVLLHSACVCMHAL